MQVENGNCYDPIVLSSDEEEEELCNLLVYSDEIDESKECDNNERIDNNGNNENDDDEDIEIIEIIVQSPASNDDPCREEEEKKKEFDSDEMRSDSSADVIPMDIVPMDVKPSISAIQPKIQCLEINQEIYAESLNPADPWVPATITDILRENDQYTVVYEDGTDNFLYGSHCAYKKPPEYILKEKTRIVANYTANPNDSYPKRLYPGTILESARSVNRDRYLIFFDCGPTAYISRNDIYLIAGQGKNPTLTKSRTLFLEKYFEKYPERALLKVNSDDKIYVRSNGHWIPGFVKEIDCSQMRLYFPETEEEEWIFRGSFRLQLLYHVYRPRSFLKNKTSNYSHTRKPEPYVQYQRDDESSINVPARVSRNVAKKSTSCPNMVNHFYFGVRPIHRTREVQDPNCKLHVVDFRKTITILFEGRNHISNQECGPHCISPREDLDDFRDHNPFTVPLYYGWKREYKKTKPRNKAPPKNPKTPKIVYISPCGQEMRSPRDIYEYLYKTKSDLVVDLFCFDNKLSYIDNNDNLRMSYIVYQRDIAQEKENHSISVINQLNENRVTEFIYSENRIPTPSVDLILDNEFLPCCDCTDNCRDWKNCQCQVITHEMNYSFFPNDDRVGYDYKRLNDGALSGGIFECNVRCPCNKTCPNRLISLGTRMQLQIYRTERKGWGIRCLHDIPKGTFITVYAAEILDPLEAEKIGKIRGDEYLADLDFIENYEFQKYGYESEAYVSDEDSSDDDDHNDRDYRPSGRYKRIKNGNEEKEKIPEKKNGKNEKKEKKKYVSHRSLYKQERTYTLDAKNRGNIGRYLNHSCDPNCFVQNVFHDTHDLRFPCIAFFSSRPIKALEEITWNYGYEVGTVEDRAAFCYCESKNCRGRLL